MNINKEVMEYAEKQERWLDPETIKIQPNNIDGYFVTYFNPKKQKWIIKTTDEYWGTKLANAIKKYNPNSGFESEKYEEIADIIMGYCDFLIRN